MASIKEMVAAQQTTVENLDSQVSAILAAVGQGQLDPAVIEQQISDATQDAIQEVLDTLNGLNLTELKTRTELQAKLTEIQNTYNPDTKFFWEMFSSLYTVKDSISVGNVETVSGDDSVDVSDSSELVVGREYVIEQSGTIRFVVVAEILSATRFRAVSNLDYSFTAGNMFRTTWAELNGEAVLEAGKVYYSVPVNIDTVENTDKALVVRRSDSAANVRVFYKNYGEWIECHWEWKRSAKGVDGYMDYEYRIPARGEFRIKVTTDGATIIKHMVGVSRDTGLQGTHRNPETPIIALPADAAVDVGEQPSLTSSAYSHPTNTPQRGTVFQIATTADGFDAPLVDSGEVAGISFAPDKDILQVSTTYYVRAKHIDEYGGESGWSVVTSFTTSASFVTVNKPIGSSPAEGEELGSPDSLTLVSGEFSTEGGTDTHAHSQWQISTDPTFVTTLYDSGSSTDLLSHAVPDSTIERGTAYYWRVRHEGTSEGWSDWSVAVGFSVANFGNGLRVDGGIMIGPMNFADTSVGYLVVAPASQRTQLALGLSGTDIPELTPVSSSVTPDENTGVYNSSILTSASYNSIDDGNGSIGSPAANYCKDLTFESQSNYFLPNIDELKFIANHHLLIDSVDDTAGSLLQELASYAWSSSQYDYSTPASCRLLIPSNLFDFTSSRFSAGEIIPCLRQLFTTTAERVSGGIKVGPFAFADGEIGYLIVAPASQRTSGVAFGLYGTDVAEIDTISSVNKNVPDSHTGAYNTSVLVSSGYNSINDGQGSIGCPVANLCANMTFEEQSGYFLPNKEELKFILANKAAIDAVDNTSGSTLETINTGNIWTSTEYTSTLGWVRRASDNLLQGYDKNVGTGSWVVPCRRIIS